MTPRRTVAEVAAAPRRHVVTVRRALEAGLLHGTQRVKGGRWTVQPECAEAWVDGVPCPHHSNVVPLVGRTPARSAS
ncbi:hypothetical protein [Cellulomonas olei]|uniref:hypothetical protein n=1 Tax=Cellulomonas sp. P4 TaxID=3142533 RepID=UPI0031BA6835